MQKQTMIIVAVALFIVASLLGVSIFAVLYLTAGETFPVIVAASDLEANHRIQEYELAVKEVDNQPDPDVLTSKEDAVGKVTSRALNKGKTITAGALREKFIVFEAAEDIASRARIDRTMLRRELSDEKPPRVIDDLEAIKGKMARRRIGSGEILTKDDIYLTEQRVAIAARAIKPNTILRADQLKVERRPVDAPDAVSDPTKLAGRSVRRNIKAGEIVRQSDLHDDDMQLSYFIPLYKRAVSVPVSNYNSVAYMSRPGDLVDLYVYTPMEIGAGARQVGEDMELHTLQKIADGAEILTLDASEQHVFQTQPPSEKKKGQMQKMNYESMTMAVDLTEAEKTNLVLGMQQQGMPMRFFVILRPRIMDSQYGLRRMTNKALFSSDEGQDIDRRIESRQIEIIQGDEAQTLRVPRYR
ncbi:MAG: Flp pilus assembly protein CpaB [bacterium]